MTESETQVSNEAAIIVQKFTDQEERFCRLEANIARLRQFFVKHHDALAPFRWHAYGYDMEVKFDLIWKADDAKSIAKAMGSDGWKRVASTYACGSINWHKDLEGVSLIIEGAEQIKPKLIDEVKL